MSDPTQTRSNRPRECLWNKRFSCNWWHKLFASKANFSTLRFCEWMFGLVETGLLEKPNHLQRSAKFNRTCRFDSLQTQWFKRVPVFTSLTFGPGSPGCPGYPCGPLGPCKNKISSWNVELKYRRTREQENETRQSMVQTQNEAKSVSNHPFPR